MATFQFLARRLIIAGGFAVAVAAAPAIALVAMPAPHAAPVACAGGEEEDMFTNICVPHTVPNSGASFSSTAPDGDGLPSVNIPGGGGAIPCTGGNSGQCIGLEEEAAAAGPAAVPQSSESNSPTVHGSEGG